MDILLAASNNQNQKCQAKERGRQNRNKASDRLGMVRKETECIEMSLTSCEVDCDMVCVSFDDMAGFTGTAIDTHRVHFPFL